MAKFKVAVSYVASYLEEIIEIEADTIKKAKEKCDEIKLENERRVERLNSYNVYVSKIISNCKLDKITWEHELLGCAKVDVIKSENNI